MESSLFYIEAFYEKHKYSFDVFIVKQLTNNTNSYYHLDMNKKEFYTRLGKAAYEYGVLYETYSSKINKRTDNFIWILYAIDFNGLETQKEIADHWSMPLSTVNTIIKQMEKEGYVELIKKEDDGRERKIKLTLKGTQYSKDILKNIYLAEDKAYRKLKNPKELIEEYERLVSETKKAIKEIDNND